MSRGAKIAAAVLGVAVVALVIVVVVMVEHAGDDDTTASKRVTPDRMERFDTIVVLPADATTFAVSDIEERLNRLDAVDVYAEIPRESLAYLLSTGGDGTTPLLDEACAQPTVRGYAVALTKPAAEARRQLSTALGSDATVLSSRYEPPQTEIFMRVRATRVETMVIAVKLKTDPDVVSYRFLDHGDAYEEFKRLFANEPELIRAATPAGLPESFRLDLRDGVAPKTISDAYGSMPGVDTVKVPTATGVPADGVPDVCADR